MSEREVRYCTTDDGVRIAYCVEGEGPPLLICPQFVESFSLDHLNPDRAAFIRRLGEGRRLVRYDMRGVGLSQRDADEMFPESMARDLRAVADAVGEPLSIWAPTTSGPRAIRFAVTAREMVRKLILYGTFARTLDCMTVESLRGFESLARANWEVAAQTLADLGSARTRAAETAARAGQIFAESTTGETVARFIASAVQDDVSDLLPRIRLPTLVIHRLNDTFCPVTVGQALAARIPDARLVTPPGTVNAAHVEDSASILDAAITFLNEDADTRQAPPAGDTRERPGAFRTVLFTDLVGHAEMMQRLGDAKGREVLREHERITREVLKAHDGAELKTMGDGFMASFGSVTKALECAIALQRAFEARAGDEPLRVRVGLNAGEPIAEEGDLFGSTVILASRICAQAGPGEILVPDPVRHLLSGKDFLFSDRGDVVLKGFEDPVRIYEVRWRG
jgi:class 3 adenylate cyclase